MKTTMMQFRVNDEEKALIEKCAKKEGRPALGTPSYTSVVVLVPSPPPDLRS